MDVEKRRRQQRAVLVDADVPVCSTTKRRAEPSWALAIIIGPVTDPGSAVSVMEGVPTSGAGRDRGPARGERSVAGRDGDQDREREEPQDDARDRTGSMDLHDFDSRARARARGGSINGLICA